MDLRQILTILRARLVLIVTVLLMTVSATIIVSVLTPNTYTGKASLVIDVKGNDPVVGGVVVPVQLTSGYLATQIDIMGSQRVALKVVKSLRLAENPVEKQQFEEATKGKGSIDYWLADRLLRKVTVKPARESSVVTIEYRAADPQLAAAVTNALAQGYIDTNLELRVEPARRTAAWFNEQTEALRDALHDARARLSKYQRDTGIVGADERLDVETARLSDLSTQLVRAQKQTYDSHNRERKAKELLDKGASAEELVEVLNQPMIVGLKSDISRAEANVQELESQQGKNHPQFRQAQAKLGEMRRKLTTEIGNITRSLGNTNTINQRGEAEIKGALEAQRQKVLDMKQKRDEMAVLMREVKSAQKGFDAVSSRFTQTFLESQINQTTIAILNPAVEPREPSSPNLLLNIALSIVLGSILGTGIVFVLELVDRRIRSADDLKSMFDLPVLGVLHKERNLKKRFGAGRKLLKRPKAAALTGHRHPGLLAPEFILIFFFFLFYL